MPRKPRRAKLEIQHTDPDTARWMESQTWCRLVGRNGKIQMAGELLGNGPRARAAIIRAMVDVIEDSGRVVLTPEELGVIVDKAKTFGRHESRREAAKAAMGITKAEEASR